MQGIFLIDERGTRRPKSKKEVKEVLAATPERVIIEATSLFGNEYNGVADLLPLDEQYKGEKIYFVGPDPYTKRNFYGTIEIKNGKVVAS